MKRTATRVATVAVVVLLAACGSTGGGSEQPSGTPSEPTTSPGATSAPTTSPPSSHELPVAPTTPSADPSAAAATPEVVAAVADLADHLGVDPTVIRVVSYEDVTWPDGSLGCPRPGMSYPQALVPGSRLLLEAEGRQYAYHSGRDAELRRCDSPQPPVRR